MNNDNTTPLVLDLDGTLLRTDSLWEMLCLALGAGKSGLFKALCGGKVAFKKYLAEHTELSPGLLPWNENIIALAREAKAEGREVWLATAAYGSWAEQAAGHFCFFSGVLSTGEKNLNGEAKAAALMEKFGLGGYDYAGDAFCDVPVWEKARAAYVVTDNKKLVAKAAKSNPNLTHIPLKRGSLLVAIVKALRPHQWTKNALLFVAFLLGHVFTSHAFLLSLSAFCFFSLTASSVYLINDLLDLASDRNHPEKRFRPFAAGNLSIAAGFLLASGLMAAAFFPAALLLPPAFSIVLAAYVVSSFLYSLWLKRVVLLDAIILSMLYVLRIAAGAFVLSVSLSHWLFSFSLFIFLALALCKRITELRLRADAGIAPDKNRGYQVRDLPFLCAVGGGAVCAATMTLALYVDNSLAMQFYASPKLLLLFCPVLLFWFGRLLLFSWRGEMMYDPVMFVLKDKTSRICMGLGIALFALATRGV